MVSILSNFEFYCLNHFEWFVQTQNRYKNKIACTCIVELLNRNETLIGIVTVGSVWEAADDSLIGHITRSSAYTVKKKCIFIPNYVAAELPPILVVFNCFKSYVLFDCFDQENN